MYRQEGDRGQVESIGTVLFLGVVVLSMSTFGVFYVANASSAVGAQGAGADTGTVRVGVSVERLTVSHDGGESIPVDELMVAVRNDSDETEHTTTSAATATNCSRRASRGVSTGTGPRARR